MGDLAPDAQAAFLRDLRVLFERHGVVITGCGCCDSPSVDQLSDDPVKSEAALARVLHHLASTIGWEERVNHD